MFAPVQRKPLVSIRSSIIIAVGGGLLGLLIATLAFLRSGGAIWFLLPMFGALIGVLLRLPIVAQASVWQLPDGKRPD